MISFTRKMRHNLSFCLFTVLLDTKQFLNIHSDMLEIVAATFIFRDISTPGPLQECGKNEAQSKQLFDCLVKGLFVFK